MAFTRASFSRFSSILIALALVASAMPFASALGAQGLLREPASHPHKEDTNYADELAVLQACAQESENSVGPEGDCDGDGYSNMVEWVTYRTTEQDLGATLFGWLQPSRTPLNLDNDPYPNDMESCYGSDTRDPASHPADMDGDGTPDADCSRGGKTWTGDTDRDGDGVDNDEDFAPDDPRETMDTDGDGVGDTADADDDNDGWSDDYELSTCTSTKHVDTDEDGIADPVDPEPCNDYDRDGVLNDVDNCLHVHNPDQNNHDGDGLGDVCELDDDNDGVEDWDGVGTCSKPEQRSATYKDRFNRTASEFRDWDCDGTGDVADPNDDEDQLLDSQEDVNGNGIVDAGETSPWLDDTDADTKKDHQDNCPTTANSGQQDTPDADGVGNACDPDDDNDSDLDVDDNCPTHANPNQEDLDGDGLGDACDSDRDGDGVANTSDSFPDDRAEWLDTDGDGVGDNADADDDNDGESDQQELDQGSDPKNDKSKSSDLDGDDIPNAVDPTPSG